MCRLKTQCCIHTFIKCILNGESDSNLNCPSENSPTTALVMQCNAMQCILVTKGSFLYDVRCSLFTEMSTHSLFGYTWMEFLLSINRFLCVYLEHFRRLHNHLYSYVLAVRLCMFACFLCMNCANLIICHPFRLHSFFVQNPTQFNSNEKTFHAHTQLKVEL